MEAGLVDRGRSCRSSSARRSRPSSAATTASSTSRRRSRPTARARVVLATGLRGKPRLLAVPGANLEKVAVAARRSRRVRRTRTCSSSAVATRPSRARCRSRTVGARSTLSYRGDGFKRCKQGNQKRLAEMIASSTLDRAARVERQGVHPGDQVSIKLKDGSVDDDPEPARVRPDRRRHAGRVARDQQRPLRRAPAPLRARRRPRRSSAASSPT